jgi:hypothetical protein
MTFLRSLHLHLARGLVRHGYPWVPTDQAHGRPCQVGPAYQKTRLPVSGPNRTSWWPTWAPEDLLEDSPDDLVPHDLKTWRTRQDIGGFQPKQIDGIWQVINHLDLDILVITDQEYGNRPHLLANIRRTRRPLYNAQSPRNTNWRTRCRVLLSRGPNQYKLVVFSVFRVLMCDLRVLSLRFHPTKQLNHWD